MSILTDRIRPLDPSSLQEFLATDHDAGTQKEHAETSWEPEDGPLDSGGDAQGLGTGQ